MLGNPIFKQYADLFEGMVNNVTVNVEYCIQRAWISIDSSRVLVLSVKTGRGVKNNQ